MQDQFLFALPQPTFQFGWQEEHDEQPWIHVLFTKLIVVLTRQPKFQVVGSQNVLARRLELQLQPGRPNYRTSMNPAPGSKRYVHTIIINDLNLAGIPSSARHRMDVGDVELLFLFILSHDANSLGFLCLPPTFLMVQSILSEGIPQRRCKRKRPASSRPLTCLVLLVASRRLLQSEQWQDRL